MAFPKSFVSIVSGQKHERRVFDGNLCVRPIVTNNFIVSLNYDTTKFQNVNDVQISAMFLVTMQPHMLRMLNNEYLLSILALFHSNTLFSNDMLDSH